MGTPRTLETDESFDDVDGELRHSEVNLKAHALTGALAGPFTALRIELKKQASDESELIDKKLLAQAMALSADDDLNQLVDDTKNGVLAAFGNDYQAPLYKQLFSGQSPSELKRPLLGTQLATMRLWVGPLNAAGITELSAIATRLSAAILKADEAEKQIALAQQALDVFQAGQRATFINECNASRKLTFGKLGEIIHGHPELPNDFSDRFFKSNGGSRAPTIAEMTQSIARLRAKLERQEAQLETMKTKAALQEKARQEAELAERKAKLDAAQKRAAEAAAEVAKLEAELAGGSTGGDKSRHVPSRP